MMMLSSSYRTKFWFSRGKVRLLQLLRSEADYRHYLLKTFQSIPAVFFLVLSKLIWTGLTHVVSVAYLNCLVKLGFANVWNQHHVIKRCLSIQNASLQRFHLYVQISRNPQTTLILKIEKIFLSTPKLVSSCSSFEPPMCSCHFYFIIGSLYMPKCGCSMHRLAMV